MKILFHLGHPAHFHLFKNIIKNLKENKCQIKILIKKKDILEDLLIEEGLEFFYSSQKGRGDNNFSIAWGLFIRDLALLRTSLKFKPELLLGTSAEITHIGKLLNIPSVVVNEDDSNVVPLFSCLSYPFANHILTPSSCKTGKWKYKSINYDGYHELAYLHPNKFSTNAKTIDSLHSSNSRYFILRFAKLTAYHDTRKRGISTNIALKIIKMLEQHGKIYISSERELEPQLEKLRININPINIHHALFYADMYIGDSQTMAAEAAVLGTPSIRFNDFVGKLGYLEELEHKYGLTYGIKTSELQKLYIKIQELLNTPSLKEKWQDRRKKMLSEKIDVTAFMVWFIANYPESVEIMKKEPSFQREFK